MYSNTVIDNNQEKQLGLDVLVPEKIIENFKGMQNCTKELIELIESTQFVHLKKLAVVFLAIDNYDLEQVIETTVSKKRHVRYNATFIMFTWIKEKFTKLSKLAEVEAVYETVFVSRFRDIDPAIRAMCVQFLVDWAYCCKALRNMTYLKYLGWALNDRNDSVRRKALKGITRLTKKRDGMVDEVLNFVEKYKTRMLEMAKQDINPLVQKEAARALTLIYLKNTEILTRQEVISLLLFSSEKTEAKSLVFKKICPDGIWDLDALHSLIAESKELLEKHTGDIQLIENGSMLFKCMDLSIDDQKAFILNIIDYIKNKSVCCTAKSLCFLQILSFLDLFVDPVLFIQILDIVKDNQENVKLTVESLLAVKSFQNHPASTFKLLDYLVQMVKQVRNCCYIDFFVQLLKLVEHDFEIQVNHIVNELKERYLHMLVRHFDLSNDFMEINNSTLTPITVCYIALWKMMKNEYEWINIIDFNLLNRNVKREIEEEENNNTNICREQHELCELIDFSILLLKKIPMDDANVTSNQTCNDSISAGKLLFNKISAYIATNCKFEDEFSCLFLFKLISYGHFTFLSKQLFKYCKQDTLKVFIGQIKEIKSLLIGYFEYLLDIDENLQKNKLLTETAKYLASRIPKKETDRYVFGYLKKLVNRTRLLDTVLINFVPLLSTNESIVLENLTSKSKMKTLLLKKCKSANITKENVTFI